MGLDYAGRSWTDFGWQQVFGTLRTRLCGLHSGYTGDQRRRALDKASKQPQGVAQNSMRDQYAQDGRKRAEGKEMA